MKQASNKLCSAFASLNNKEDIFAFLQDLLTEKEILEFSRRFEVAEMLQNKKTYYEIEKETGMSSTTIARISKFLSWENQWYDKALKSLKSITEKHHTGHH